MGEYVLSSSPRIVGKVPATRQRRSFQCPEEDKQGSALTDHGISTIASSGKNGSSSQTILSCTYGRGAEACDYDEDGVFSLGPSTCPDGTPPNPLESTTQVVTQTQIVTETADPPAPPTLTSSSQNSFTSLPPSSAPSSPSFSSTSSTFLSSSASQGSSLPPSSGSVSQTSNTSLPAEGQSTVHSSNSLAAGAIVGITIGVVAVLILAVILALCVRRARRRQHTADLAPESYFIVSPEGPTLSTGVAPVSSSLESISTAAQNRQEYLTTQLRAVQKQLEALQASGVGTGGAHLEEAMQQNDALRVQIRMLEREMQSQWGLRLTDSPPAYLD
ncbi:hypothetical protein B0H14DRAFT_2985231 [Mycena olivaceomarginata]|nr:hypothetical protein B0H14DRAFT_2985231 [Mycena olivaceomarginata]